MNDPMIDEPQPAAGSKAADMRMLAARREVLYLVAARSIMLLQEELRAQCGQAADLLRLVRRDKPALVVIDTLAAAFPGLEENKTKSMGVVLQVARNLARGDGGQPGPAVLILHHTPKADGGTPRGHGSLAGDADIMRLLDELLASFVAQGRMKLPGSVYRPCYRLVA